VGSSWVYNGLAVLAGIVIVLMFLVFVANAFYVLDYFLDYFKRRRRDRGGR